jgi:6-phospho-beta-glucosidase
MARVKIAYIGGGSSRAPGTVASLIERGKSFEGSEVVLIDLNQDTLDIVQRLATRLASVKGVDITFRSTTDRRAGLTDCDAVLTAYRPGGFEARVIDERVPLKHDVIGQETQGPGGFFMALRSIHVMKGIVADIEERCPQAWIFNYTNPVNIVSQAVSMFSSVPIYSFCEGPFIFPRLLAEAAGLDPDKAVTSMVGVNHNCWSTEHRYEDGDLIDAVRERYDDLMRSGLLTKQQERILHMAVTMDAIPSYYFQYYYYKDDLLRELKASPTTRAEDIVAELPGYWQHYMDQAESDHPELDPDRSRGGVHELELALDAISAVFNDEGIVLPTNLPNTSAPAQGFDEDVVVEIPCRVSRAGFEPISQPRLPAQVRGLVEALAEYQVAAAGAAVTTIRRDAVRALAANPLVGALPKAEALYAEMAHAQAALLPEGLR